MALWNVYLCKDTNNGTKTAREGQRHDGYPRQQRISKWGGRFTEPTATEDDPDLLPS